MNVSEELNRHVNRIQRGALGLGVAALIACIVGAFFNPTQFLQSYLFAFVFWVGIAVGSLAVEMTHHATGGAWGFVIRRLLEAASTTLILLCVLGIPILIGMKSLFIWTHPDQMAAVATAHEIRNKSGFFLNVPWFIIRYCVYFIVWIGLAVLLRKWSLQQDRTGDPALTPRFQYVCCWGLVLYVLTISFAAMDWIMSLEPMWYSTIFGMLVICGQGVGTFGFMLAVAIWLARRQLLVESVSPDTFRDLGGLMLAFVLLWAYMAFSQYLIIWSGNTAKESSWYLHHGHNGWSGVAYFLIAAHFLFPFILLLFGHIKRNVRSLAAIAALLLFAHFVDVFWMIMPSFYTGGFTVHWMDVLLPISLGGLWMAWFIWQVKQAPLVPLQDPRLAGQFNVKEALERG
ncbi:MAG TPA: hypothetical protein VFB38_00460 [Chthonomonadaceae bacterium]|nr:hypothetical protein [Chthonomonadaceae bacterium]